MDASHIKDVKLSAEVEPFIPQKKGLEGSLVSMSLSGEPGGGGGGGGGIGGGNGGVETTPIPSYLITCYPFVQESQPNRQHQMYNAGELRWQQPNPGPGGPYLAYPIMSSPQPPVSNDYTYYQIMPAPCPPVMGFYQPFPSTYGGPVQPGVVNPVSPDVGERLLSHGPPYGMAHQRGRGMGRPNLPKQQLGVCQPPRGRRPPNRSLVMQKELCPMAHDSWSKKVLVDASQQTDFPGEIAGRCFMEPASPMLWTTRTNRLQGSNPAESYSDQGTSEVDIDSDSGYCSPKHKQATGVAHQTAKASTSSNGVETGVMTSTWVNVTSQATQKPWGDKNGHFHRVDQRKNPEQKNFSQDFHSVIPGRGLPNHSEQRLQPGLLARDEITPKPLYFEDEDEFPDLASGHGVQRCAKAEVAQTQVQPRLHRNMIENIAEDSPINIMQTPIRITTSVPKRAKSHRKKALAAAKATAQEYSEISMEQQKLQEALIKAAGKKSKTSVPLDLGDMLAALAKQQQAMKAKQITNTKPLAFTVGTITPFHSSASTNLAAMLKGHPQPQMGALNPLDSTPPRMKRGKEREIPKVKRPTALKKIILKEREGKKGKTSMDHESSAHEEHGADCLHFTEDLSQEPASQEENGLSVPSDASLSPASQNSPYSITPVSQGSPSSSGIGSPMASNAITIIHSRRFREYCNQVLSKEIDESVTLLLQELVRFQEVVHQKDPIKAKSKRRLVMGLREVTKHMKLCNLKCVIISPNCEKIQAKGGLDEALYNVISMAREQEIPFVFALGRKALGRCVNKLVSVSVVGIINYSGAERLFEHLVSLTEEATKAYKEMVSSLEQEQAEEALKHVKKVPHHMGHSRNHSAASATSFCSVISEPISEVNEKEYETTNWRSMVETVDAPETAEAEVSAPSPPVAPCRDNETVSAPASAVPQRATPGHGERDEVRADDRLELASQQSTETGSLDGSCRGPLNSSITSTTSTLVPGMLEEAEQEDEEEEDYTPKPISVEVPTLNSRIESWLSKTLEMQLGKTQDSTEEEEDEEEEDEEEEEEEAEDEDEERVHSGEEEGLVTDGISDTKVEDKIKEVEAKEVTA
ncbi:selenocysteine insertion sequence-binding protein 2-like isoform X2 [Stigmatopora nigra]